MTKTFDHYGIRKTASDPLQDDLESQLRVLIVNAGGDNDLLLTRLVSYVVRRNATVWREAYAHGKSGGISATADGQG